MTTDKEHAALEWLDGATHPLMSDIEDIRHTNTLKSMLARLPSPTDHAAIDALAQRAPTIPRQWIAEIIRIMHEPPAPKTKTVWRVCGVWANGDASLPADFDTLKQASDAAGIWQQEGCHSISIAQTEVAPAADGCRGRTLAERRA